MSRKNSMQSLVLSFPIVTYFCSLQRCAVFLWSNAWALKEPWINPKNHPGNVHRQKLKLMEVGWGFTGSLDVEAYPKKTIAMAFLQKSSDIKKSTAANSPSRHHGDVHSHHTLWNFLQQVIGILGHTMCLYFVFWINHMLALHPGKPKNTNGGFGKTPRRPSGAVFSTP